MAFIGTYEHSIDAKNRLAIPANIRARILEEAGTRAGEPVLLYVTMGENGALCIYTRAMFEKRSAELRFRSEDLAGWTGATATPGRRGTEGMELAICSKQQKRFVRSNG